jgi:hypothetical protein
MRDDGALEQNTCRASMPRPWTSAFLSSRASSRSLLEWLMKIFATTDLTDLLVGGRVPGFSAPAKRIGARPNAATPAVSRATAPVQLQVAAALLPCARLPLARCR